MLQEADRQASRLELRGGAQTRRVADIAVHVALLAQLVAHRLRSLLSVRGALIARLLVEVADGGPPPLAGSMVPDHALLRKIDIAENDIITARIALDDGIPRRSLLASSASARGGNPAHHQGLARVDCRLDLVVEGAHSELGGVIEVVTGIDGLGKPKHHENRNRIEHHFL